MKISISLAAAGLAVLGVAACTPGTTDQAPAATASGALQAAGGKTATCNLLRSEKYRLEAQERSLSNTSKAGMIVPGLVMIAIAGGGAASLYAQSRVSEAKAAGERARELGATIKTRDCRAQDSAVLDQSGLARLQSDGVYQGRGKTESWCQTPAIKLTLEQGRVTGSFWERTGGDPTSIVKGNVTPEGVLQLQFDGIDTAYFTGDIDVDYRDGQIAFVLPAAKNCLYTFWLRRGSTEALEPAPAARAHTLPPKVEAAPPQTQTASATPTPTASAAPVPAPIIPPPNVGAAVPQTPPASAMPTQTASAAPDPTSLTDDGTWQMEMVQLSTTYGTTVGGECPTRHAAPVTFAKGTAEGPWGKLELTRSGEVSGWMRVPGAATSTLPFIVNVSGRLQNHVLKGTVSGRCTGSFVMTRQG